MNLYNEFSSIGRYLQCTVLGIWDPLKTNALLNSPHCKVPIGILDPPDSHYFHRSTISADPDPSGSIPFPLIRIHADPYHFRGSVRTCRYHFPVLDSPGPLLFPRIRIRCVSRTYGTHLQ